MFNSVNFRYRYAQFFVLLLLCSSIYIMARTARSGIANFEDNFYQRDILIGGSNLFRMKLGDRVFPAALLGKDGWMEYTGEENIDDFQNINSFKNKKKFAQELTALDQYLNSQGITLLIVVAPNKASIYPDTIPDEIQPQSASSRLDGLISYLKDNNLPLLLDLRPALRTARKEQDVYYKTDTHWNGYGAFVAYTTILNALEGSHPELKPYKASDLKLVVTDPAVRDIPKTMRINSITEPAFFYSLETPLVQTTHPGDYIGYNQFSWIDGSDLPTLLMFHDSFGSSYMDNYLNNYLSMNFGKSHFFQIQSMPKYFTLNTVQKFKPDIIVVEIVERNLYLLPEYFSSFVIE